MKNYDFGSLKKIVEGYLTAKTESDGEGREEGEKGVIMLPKFLVGEIILFTQH